MQAGEVKRDESGKNAEADAAQRKHGAVGSHAPEDVRERQMTRGRDRDARQTKSEDDGSQGYAKYGEARGRKSPVLLQQNAKRRANGKGAECGDAVPGNDFRNVLRADAPDSPHRSAGAGHAFPDAEQEASEKEKDEADKRTGIEEGGDKGKQAASGTSKKPEDHDAFGAEDVHHAPGARARKDGGDILGADDESCEDCSIAELQVDVHRENGEGDADGEVTDESEGYGRKNFGDAAAGKFRGARKRGGFRERIGGRGDGGVGHCEKANP